MFMPPTRKYSDTASLALAAVAFLLLAALVVRDGIVLIAGVFVCALYIAMRAWSRIAARSVEVVRRCPDRAVVGEAMEVELLIRNRSRLPIPWIELSESVPAQLGGAGPAGSVISLGPLGEHVLDYSVVPCRRGLCRVGPLSVGTGDILGIENHKLVVHESRRVLVYPRIVPLARLGLPGGLASAAVPARRSLFEDPSRMVGVREYRPGDSLRHMHWPATAQAGRPHIRQFEPAIGRPTLLCLDLDPYAGAVEDAVAVAASLAHHIVRREEQPVGLVTQGADPDCSDGVISIVPGRSESHLAHLLESLARVQPRRRDILPDLLRAAAGQLPWGASVFLISGAPHDALVHALLQVRARGHRCSILIVGSRAESGKAAPSPGIPVYLVRDVSGLESVG